MTDRRHGFHRHHGNPSRVPHEQIERARSVEESNPTNVTQPRMGGVTTGDRGDSWRASTERLHHFSQREIPGTPSRENIDRWSERAAWNSPVCRDATTRRR
jgi:hypothetical protein